MKKNKKKKQKTNNENLYNFIFYTFSVIIAVCFFLCYFGLINECTRFESANNNIDGKQKNYMEELKFELKNLDRKKKEIIKKKLDIYKAQYETASIIEPKTIYWGDITLEE